VTKQEAAKYPQIPMPIDASDMMIILRQKGMDFANFDELSEKMAKELEAVPGVPMVFNIRVKCVLMN
jgi:cobalt-zinc-cadmium resistance protein CzcA